MTQTPDEPIYDESLVPTYTLPDALACLDGSSITTPEDWWKKRRPEILQLFAQEMYGFAPDRPEIMKFHLREGQPSVMGGLAERKQVAICLQNEGKTAEIDLLIYLPAARSGPVPVFLSLNFSGNHTIHTDPAILLTRSWLPDWPGVVDHRATEAARGVGASRWPVETILERGYGLATMYYGDIDPDYDDGFENGVHALFPGEREPDDWGSIAAWAWGLSRALDYLEIDPDVDDRRVALAGHSRLGKTALWAGAADTRFALVVSNDSGCGGAALSRRRFGESVAAITARFGYWFCENFRNYYQNEDALPVDQHMLLALIAPRPLYIASAAEDLWADPRGEFLGALYASPVYHLLGQAGLDGLEMPALAEPLLGGRIGYHIRPGKHDITAYDWEQYLTFADRHLRG